jgi:TQXA domain-containing protein/LPXTG-motif cell wall-anchored protein
MVLRHRIARRAALLLSVATALLVTALPAAAATKGEFVGSTEQGSNVRIGGHQTTTSLLGLKLEDGTLLKTYCVELDIPARNGAMLAESPWSEYPDPREQFNAHPEKVLWILHNSYPNVQLNVLGAKVGVTLDAAEATAGTQAAIWHLSNGANLDSDNSADITALYAYLTGPANTGIQKQPVVSLSITPQTGVEAEVGKAAGPFTIDTTASKVELTVDGPDGVAVVDANGAPLPDITHGVQFWLSAPAGEVTGEATVKATATAKVENGRLFVGMNNSQHPTQTLIVAAGTKTTARAEAAAKWLTTAPPVTTTPSSPSSTTPTVTISTTPSNAFTVPPTTQAPPAQGGSLPNTGASVLGALGIAMLLLGAGMGALILQRRRRSRSTG